MALGTAALVLILSVYNGFNGIIESNLADMDADLLIRRFDGARFVPSGPEFDALSSAPEIRGVSSVIESKVLLAHEGKQAVASAKGVDFVYERVSGMEKHLVSGKWSLGDGDAPLAAIGTELASRLGVGSGSSIAMYYPSENFSLVSPLSSLSRKSLKISGILSINADIDANLLLVPKETLAALLNSAEGEVSGIELRFEKGLSRRGQRIFIKRTEQSLGEDFEILDRFEQNPALYKMMRYEKAAVWFILIFVVLIIAFNIFSSLSMLIIEKKRDIATLRALGADSGLIRKIFVLEAWFISLLGMLAGLLAGVLLTLLQARFGFVKMPGTFVVDAYPVILKWGDVLLAAVSVAAIGLIAASLPALKKEDI